MMGHARRFIVAMEVSLQRKHCNNKNLLIFVKSIASVLLYVVQGNSPKYKYIAIHNPQLSSIHANYKQDFDIRKKSWFLPILYIMIHYF